MPHVCRISAATSPAVSRCVRAAAPQAVAITTTSTADAMPSSFMALARLYRRGCTGRMRAPAGEMRAVDQSGTFAASPRLLHPNRKRTRPVVLLARRRRAVRGRGRSTMRRRHLLSLFLLVVGVAMLVAAVSVGAAGSATKKAGSANALKGGTLRINMHDADFDFVDPQLAYRTDDWSMIYTTSMPLVGFPEKSGAAGSQLVPIGATSFPTVSK